MNTMKKAAKATLFCLVWLWAANVSATTYYVATTGSNTSGNGSSGTPWATVAYALTKVASGDVVSINDGIYSEGQLVVPVGVSLTSTSQDKAAVVIQPSANLGIGFPMVTVSSATPGINGNQTISHITLRGRGASYIASQGIKIQNRDNVHIHHCVIEDFYGIGTSTYTNGSWGLYVSSSASPGGTDWQNYITTNYEKSASYPPNPLSGFEFDHNFVKSCGWDAGTLRNQTPSILAFHLSNSSFHDNTIDASHSPIKPLSMTNGYWDHVGFFNNIVVCHSDGVLNSSKTMWAVEVWVLFDCSFYNNKLINAGFSTTVGNRNEWYNNFIDKSGTGSGQSYAIEATYTGEGRIHHNYLRGNPSSGNMWGINTGSPQTAVPDNSTMNYYVWGNIFQNIRYHGLFVDLTNSSDGQTLNVYIYNNTFDNLNSPLNPASIRFQQDVPGSSGNIHIKNNLLVNNYLAYWTKSGTPNLTTGNNLWHGNTTNSNPISVFNNDGNKVTAAPRFAGYPTDLAPVGAGSQVDTGADLGDDYKMALSPLTNWGTGHQLPSVVLADQDANGSAWEIGAYAYGTTVSATTYYVSTTGSDSNTGLSSGQAFATISYALSKAAVGDTISVGDGAYNCPQLNIPEGVSLVSGSKDPKKVIICPNLTMGMASPFIRLVSDSPGSNGNQSISYLTIDGYSGSSRAYQGIEVKNRDNVSIHHCSIEDFQGNQTNYNGSYGIYVYSNHIAPSNQWWNFIDADLSKSSDYENAVPVSNFQFYRNTMKNCGDGDASRAHTSAIKLWLMKNSSLHDCTIDVSHAYTEAIHQTAALWDNVDLYNNTFIGHPDGSFPNSPNSKSLYLIEVWVLHNCDFYNNHLINGCFSTTTGSNDTWHDNLVDVSGARSPVGFMIEATAVDEAKIYRNRLIGNPNSGQTMGMQLGLTIHSDQKAYSVDSYVWSNIIHGTHWHGINISGKADGSVFTSSKIYLYNNLIDHCGNDPGYSGVLLIQGGSAELTATLKNNIVTNNDSYGVRVHTGSPSATLDNNCIAGNGTDLSGLTATNTVTTKPSFTNYVKGDFTLAAGSSCIDAGIDIGQPFNAGLDPLTNWASDPLVVGTLDQGAYGISWEIGPYVYNPTVSAKGINSAEFNIYPNPVKNALTISGDQGLCKYSLEVFNVYGQKLHQQKDLAGMAVRLDMSGYMPGVYMIKLADGNGRQVVRKIIKE